MHRESWWATVHGVTEKRTQRKQQYMVTKLGFYLINIMLFDLKLYCEVVFVLTRYLHGSWEGQSIPLASSCWREIK